jgi:hypothetical protein
MATGPNAVAALDRAAAAGPILVEFLIGQPTAAAKLLDEHVDNGHGECRSPSHHGHQSWPCIVRTAAETSNIERVRR